MTSFVQEELMKIGYARVSRTDQHLELQTEALRAVGVERIYQDKESGAKAARAGLDEMLKTLRAGDVVHVWRLDRLARSMQHLIELMKAFEGAGVQIVSLTENINTTSPTGRLVFHIFASIAEFERNLIIERTSAGLASARQRGRVGGRKRILTVEKKELLDLLLEKSADYRSHAKAIGVSERTVRRYASKTY